MKLNICPSFRFFYGFVFNLFVVIHIFDLMNQFKISELPQHKGLAAEHLESLTSHDLNLKKGKFVADLQAISFTNCVALCSLH